MRKQDSSLFYSYLQSQETAQKYLKKCYQQIPEIDAEAKSYENYSAFMYYLDHGQRFFSNAKKVDILLQPILLFYGTTHLLKACLLTKRPNYPESTTILAHGVSARKRKKKHYTFMNDEVKAQHNGLFSYASQHLYSLKNLPFEKIKMEKLFALIPEMNGLFVMNGQQSLVSIGKIGSTTLLFPLHLLDSYQLTQRAFIQKIMTLLPNINNVYTHSSNIQVELDKPLDNKMGPFYSHLSSGEVHFPRTREYFVSIPEVLAHYLLLYNLSMISRYETEWWGELLAIKAEVDYPFIQQFLQITATKIPTLLENQLWNI